MTPLGWAYHPGRGGPVHHGVQFPGFRLHPLFQLRLYITPAGNDGPAFEQVGDQGMVGIEVGGQRLAHRFPECNHHVIQCSQPLQPGLQGRVPI